MTPVAPTYRVAGRPAGERAADLVARMTRDEKLAQLSAVWGYEVVSGSEPDLGQMRALAANGIGQISRLSGSTNLRPIEVARAANAIQRFLVEETRLGVPAIIHEECLHGLLALGAPSFQQSIGAAATFEPGLVLAMAQAISRRMFVIGARQALAPVLDITRDPRWGRIEETYGEDPYLAAALGAAYIHGLQGTDLAEGVLATAKHLVGHGMAEGGLNQAPVHIGPRELVDEQLVPFETAVVEAGVASVMPAYCDIDGLPCHASHELLTEILRDRWQFDGLIVSDYGGIEMLKSAHRLTGEARGAAVMALEAGVDIELPRRDVYGEPLRDALDAEVVSEELIDRAVERILRLKFELGLFDRPYVDLPEQATLDDLAAGESEIGHELAVRSMVMVANDGVLPLDSSVRRVAVIGAAATSPRDFLGDYSHLVHLETLSDARRTRSTAFGIIDVGRTVTVEDELAGRRTLLDELSETLAGREVIHAPGVCIHGGTDDDIARAVDAAAHADVALVVVAERSGLTRDSTTGEFRDRQELGLFGRQQEMVEAVAATGTRVVLIVISGRPLALEWAAEHCAAILLAWVPGDFGPAAIAEIVAGVREPGGRLPVSMPRSVGQVPLNYRHHPTGGRSNPMGDYVDGPAGPLWPFGFGLGYTRFELGNLRLERETIETSHGCLAISVDVTNVGDRAGDDIVQLYIRDEEASVARPCIELRAFQRVSAAPGVTRTVEFTLHAEQLAYTGADNRRIVEPGLVTVFVGRSAEDLPLQATVTLRGPTVDVPIRRNSLSETRVI